MLLWLHQASGVKTFCLAQWSLGKTTKKKILENLIPHDTKAESDKNEHTHTPLTTRQNHF